MQINLSTAHQLPQARHAAAFDVFLEKTAPDTPEASCYAKQVNDTQWGIVAAGTYGMDDAFVLAVEKIG